MQYWALGLISMGKAKRPMRMVHDAFCYKRDHGSPWFLLCHYYSVHPMYMVIHSTPSCARKGTAALAHKLKCLARVGILPALGGFWAYRCRVE